METVTFAYVMKMPPFYFSFYLQFAVKVEIRFQTKQRIFFY